MLEIFSKGKAVKMPETLADLTALCPELIAQAKQEERASIDIEGIVSERVAIVLAEADEKIAAHVERVFGIISAALSDEIAAKIKVIVASGVTGEQYAAIGLPLVKAAIDSDKETQLKTELLAELKKTGADNPGHEGQAKGRQFNAEGDMANEKQAKIDKLVAEYQSANPQADYKDAVKAVADKNPELFRDRT